MAPKILLMSTVLETTRLQIRHFEKSDFASLYALDSDSDVMKYIGDGKVMSEDQVRTVLERIIRGYEEWKIYGVWASEIKQTGEFVGWFSLKPLPGTEEIEIGYRLMKKFWGRGYATEGGKAILKHGFEVLKLPKVVAITNIGNGASKRVLEKIGLTYVNDADYKSAPDAHKRVVSWFAVTNHQVKNFVPQ